MGWPTVPVKGPSGFAVGTWLAAPIVTPKTLRVRKLPGLPLSLTWRVFLGFSVRVLSMTATASSGSSSSPSPPLLLMMASRKVLRPHDHHAVEGDRAREDPVAALCIAVRDVEQERRADGGGNSERIRVLVRRAGG